MSDDLTPEQRAELATGRLYAGAVLKKAQAEAYERGRAAGRAEAVAELRERASEMHIKACMSGGTYTTATLSMIQALTDAADELEVRGNAPAERQDARDGAGGTSGGGEPEFSAGGAFAGDGR